MRTIGVIGLGHVGATVAYTLVSKGLADKLILIDKNDKKALAEQYDLLDATARLDTNTEIIIQDYAALKQADVLITAFGNIGIIQEDGDRFGELKFNEQAVQEVAPQIKASGFDGILINIGNPCDVVTAYLQELTGLPQKHVFGTGTFLDTARLQRNLGMKLGLSPKNIGGYVYGEHGDSKFVAWSTVTVNGRPVDEIQESYHLNYEEIEEQTNKGNFDIFFGKGYTCYAIATCVTKLAGAVLSNDHLAAPVSTYHPEFQTYVGQPAIVGADGIESLAYLELSELEHGKLATSANFIKQKIASLKH
ncbi:L-lactate dehydrogenase [Paucilactobacillus sp. N302-9]